MRLVTWNCNGALRKKYEHLIPLEADISIIQECEDPRHVKDEGFRKWGRNYLWKGDSKNKGIGIFARDGIRIDRLDWPDQYKDHSVKHFLPCRVNNAFNLLGVWTHRNNSPNFGYIGQLWKYIQLNQANFDRIIIAGDLNSNVIWDQWDRWWNHSDVVNDLHQLEISSVYHAFFNESQGSESRPTFFLHRKQVKPYHIDYVFASDAFIPGLQECELGTYNDWIVRSDHVPITVQFDLNIIPSQ